MCLQKQDWLSKLMFLLFENKTVLRIPIDFVDFKRIIKFKKNLSGTYSSWK